MKIIHLSDLHLGKRIKNISLIDDQRYVLVKILNIIDDEKPDCVVIAGDIYDRRLPSEEAVGLFDDFLVRLSARDLKVLLISGNHDSPGRIAFGGRLMDARGVYPSQVYSGGAECIPLEDEYGTVYFHMLPFVKPVNVRYYHQDEKIESYTEAVAAAVRDMQLDKSRRNVLLAHQFVTGAKRSESEEISVGGLDNVDAAVFEDFDYVALGHLHSAQNCGRDSVRYCGTPLKYSFSEAGDRKTVTIAELAEKGSLTVRTAELVPKRDLKELRGKYNELAVRSRYDGTSLQEDYLHITLTDEEDIPDVVNRLRAIYHNLVTVDYDNRRTRTCGEISEAEDVERKSPAELFADFYEMQNNQPLSAEQKTFLDGMIEKVWEEEE